MNGEVINMLVDNMNLNQIISFEPSDEDMAMLPLDVVLWIKLSIISIEDKINYEAIKYLFSKEEFAKLFKNLEQTRFYDFDGTRTKQNCFVTIGELYGLLKDSDTIDIIKETLEEYDHSADIIIDIYTHDNKKYRLSNLDGIVKCELMG